MTTRIFDDGGWLWKWRSHVGLCVSPDIGVWWLGLGRWRLVLKAPWNEPLFSERYGYKATLRIGWDWRVQSFLVDKPYA